MLIIACMVAVADDNFPRWPSCLISTRVLDINNIQSIFAGETETPRRHDWGVQDTKQKGKSGRDKAKLFQPALDTHGLRGHSQKLFKPRCRTTTRKTFFSNRIIDEWNRLPQAHSMSLIHHQSTSSCKNSLDETWRSMGTYSWEATSLIIHQVRASTSNYVDREANSLTTTPSLLSDAKSLHYKCYT